MIELQLLGASGDAQSLVLTDESGERYSVAIDDRLRALVRRDRPIMEAAEGGEREPLSPKRIQALLRSGFTPEEIAAEYSEDVERIRRWEPAIAAEKLRAVEQARAARVGADPDSPVMGDLVIDRLAARGVDASALQWDAHREDNGRWEVVLTFVQGAEELDAHWQLSPSRSSIEAVDEEARWLTETMVTEPAAAFFTPLTAASERPVAPSGLLATDEDEELREREELLAKLDDQRGTPQLVDIPLDDDDDPEAVDADDPFDAVDDDILDIADGPADTSVEDDAPAETHRAPIFGPFRRKSVPAIGEGGDGGPDEASEPESESDDPDPENVADTSEQPEVDPDQPSLLDEVDAPSKSPKSGKKGRKSVPSWDDIVFGSKP